MRKALVNRLIWFIPAFVILGFLCLPTGLTVAGGEPSAKDLYEKKCALCHGADGVAKPMWSKLGAKNFNDPAWQKETTDEAMVKVITDGVVEKKMPSYKGKLEPAEVTAVVKYIRTLAPAK